MSWRFPRALALLALALSGACAMVSGLEDYVVVDRLGEGDAAPDATVADTGVVPNVDADPGDGGGQTDAKADAPWFVIGCDGGLSDPSLLAYYPLDDGTGATAKDCSGKGHNGTIVGAAGWTATGKHGGALGFNGTNTCIDLGSGADLRLGTFTFAAWANVTDYVTASIAGYIISKLENNPNTIGWRFATFETPNRFEAKFAVEGGTAFVIDSPDAQPTGTWMHLALVFEPTKRSDLFVNGTRIATVPTPPAIYEEIAANMRIGCNSGAKDYFTGTLDDVRLYTRALTDAEIAQLAAAAQ